MPPHTSVKSLSDALVGTVGAAVAVRIAPVLRALSVRVARLRSELPAIWNFLAQELTPVPQTLSFGGAHEGDAFGAERVPRAAGEHRRQRVARDVPQDAALGEPTRTQRARIWGKEISGICARPSKTRCS